MNQRPFEAIVVGSGATGGTAALTLAEAGIRVLVLEAGPQLSVDRALGKEPANTIRRLQGLISGAHRQQAQHPGYWKQNPELYINEHQHPYSHPADRPFLWTRGHQVGGRSLTWGGITLRLSDRDFKAAEVDGHGPVWPISHQDLDPHYTALEQLLAVHGQRDGFAQVPDGWATQALASTPEEAHFASTVQQQLRFPWMPSRGFELPARSPDSPWPRSSSPGSTLHRALATGRVEVCSGQMVERLVMSPGQDRASGLISINLRDGTRTRLEAPLIVLCASTIQSLRILLNSEQQTSPGGFKDPSGRLGHSLMDHVSSCRFFCIPARSDQANPAPLSGAGSFFLPFGSYLEATESVNFLRGYGLWGGINRFDPPAALQRQSGFRLGFLIGHGEVLAADHNRVSLSDRSDAWGVPIPHIDCQWGANERAIVKHMQATMETAISAAGGLIKPLQDLLHMPLVEPLVAASAAVGEQAPPPGYYIHEVGGAPMGEDESTSVVDRWNRLWRCSNVLVADGACWPTSAWQSPTLTMMAITRRACLEAVRRSGG
ncbi:MAG: GMC family oxidoreductase [Synechococcus sp.]|nr:GMC family oxidoreductase [Synechococcus sp.]